jgi:delta 1-pyrroline-5-carboxylate dehydrogenase
LLHEAGVPEDVLQYVPCKGSVLGKTLLTRNEVAGVCFTGSTETAWTINRTLAARNAPIAALIAETGGQNALIADSSALPEQLVKDVMASAFDSAGQRCSAARVLFVQDDIADKVIAMLKGAMDELVVGDPRCYRPTSARSSTCRRAKASANMRRAWTRKRSSSTSRSFHPVPKTARSSCRAHTRFRRSSC